LAIHGKEHTMQKHILIAADDSIHTTHALRYVAKVGSMIPQLHFSLVHVQPALSQYLIDEARLKLSVRRALESVGRAHEAKADEILIKATNRLIQSGIAKDHIDRKSIPRDAGVASDILIMGQAEPFDAIVVGRRGASQLREWLLGSVTASLIEHSKVIPIWVIDGEVDATDTLMAADGSRASLRALDHLAYMLSGEEKQQIHILHVRPRFQDFCDIELEPDTAKLAKDAYLDNDQDCMDDFYPKAIEVLQKNGITKERLAFKTIDGNLSIPRAILAHARNNNFGTLVMGCRGRSKSKFAGSVSRSLIQKIENCALWMVP
jgi:nucleotide-binding universal stress UspA family protein